MFTANSDRYTVIKNVLKKPLITRYIRIHPESWYGHISMRTEFFGCRKGNGIYKLLSDEITQGTLRLSELTGQPIFVVMRFSLLIKTNPPEQWSILKRRWFSAKILCKSQFHLQNERPGLPVLTFGKRPRLVQCLTSNTYFKKYKKQIKNIVSFFPFYLRI